MLIVGLNAFHPDSAACALVECKLGAAVAEERLGPRHKKGAGFPFEFIDIAFTLVLTHCNA